MMVMGQAAGKQSARQAARRAALDAQSKMRTERIDREKRLSALGVTVTVALGERDEAIARCEQRARDALRAMVEQEGLSLREAADWCGPGLSRREATRLRRSDAGGENAPEGNDAGEPAQQGDADQQDQQEEQDQQDQQGEPAHGPATGQAAPAPVGPAAAGSE